MTEKQRAFLAHVGKLYAACVGDPHANIRTIMEADAALQHIVRDARNAGLAPRDIADAMRLPLASVLA